MVNNSKQDLENLAAEGRDFLARSLKLGKIDFRFLGQLAELNKDARVEEIELDRDELCGGFSYDVIFNRTLDLEEFRDLIETYFGKHRWSDNTIDIYAGPTGGSGDFAGMHFDTKDNRYRVHFEPINGFEEE